MNDTRRFIQGPITQQLARPALRAEVMRALHHRPVSELTTFIEKADIDRLLEPRDYGVWDTLLALAEYDLVETFAPNPVSRRPARVVLTQPGRQWRAADPDQGETETWEHTPMRYAYQVNGDIHAGTLEDWAKTWERGEYTRDVQLSHDLITWKNRAGYRVQVDRLSPLDDEWIDYRIWAAGEQVAVRIDGRA